MGLACGNVLAIQVPVDVDGDVDRLHDRVGTGRKSPAPHLVAHNGTESFLAMTSDARRHAKKRLAVILIGGVAGVAVGLAGIYGIGRLLGNAGVAEACRPAANLAQKLTPLARGEVAAVAPAKAPISVADLKFQGPDGRERTLAEWRGRTVLLNLWATWCVPCRKEMPALDALQAKLGGADFEVVAVNIDTRNLDKPKTWLSEVNVTSSPITRIPTPGSFRT
jgi:thiol-disulfide isomerase/thioredoxin